MFARALDTRRGAVLFFALGVFLLAHGAQWVMRDQGPLMFLVNAAQIVAGIAFIAAAALSATKHGAQRDTYWVRARSLR